MSVAFQQSFYPSTSRTMTTYLDRTGFAQSIHGMSKEEAGGYRSRDFASSSVVLSQPPSDADNGQPKGPNINGTYNPRQAEEESAPNMAGRLGTEICEVDGMRLDFPVELFDLSDLSEVLSLETWNDVLSDDDREQLAQFLPPVEGEDLQEALQDLLGGFNVNFGNPRESLFARLRSGQCNPRVASFRKGLQILQRKQHYHNVRRCHNKMVNRLLDMKRTWQLLPEAQLEQKLKHWNNGKDGAVAKSHHRSADKQSLAAGKYADSPIYGKSGPIVPLRQQTRPSTTSVNGGDSQAGAIRPSVQTVKGLEHQEIHVAPKAYSSHNGMSAGLRKEKRRRSSDMEEEAGLDSDDEPLARSAQKRWQGGADQGAWKKSGTITIKKETSSLPAAVHSGKMKGGVPKSGSKAFGNGEGKGWQESGRGVSGLPRLGPADATVGFSVLHLLSAVRSALLRNRDPGAEELDWLAVSEIVERVRAVPGDPRVLNAKQGLPEVVRQALLVLHTKAPPGTRMWKPFVQQKKQFKEWAWCGVVPQESEEFHVVHIEPEYWGVAEKALAKLQERMMESLNTNSASKPSATPAVKTERSGEGHAPGRSSAYETVKGSPSLPSHGLGKDLPDDRSPSHAKSTGKDFDKAGKEAFKGSNSLGSLKSQVTLPELTPRMRERFRAEERQRFAYPQEAFHYTAVDGGQSIVAPIQRINGKSLGKAREHAMLVPDRPPHVTVLSLVRDAAARLPLGVGTRADVCMLLKDSQYFVQETPDSQLQQIVSGAMDRLHYERDPCITYHAEQKLWEYLHRDRSPEDFEADGTMSTRNWGKRKPFDSAEYAGEENGEGSPSPPESPTDEPLAMRLQNAASRPRPVVYF